MTVQDRLKLKRKSALLVTDDILPSGQKNNLSHNLNQFAVMRKSKMINNNEKQNFMEMFDQTHSS